MNMRKFLVGAAALLISCTLFAEEATSDDAQLVAKGWVYDNAKGFGEQLGELVSVTEEKNDAGETLWYWAIFEKGAVVVSPDTELDPVVAMLPGCDGTLPEGHPMRALLLNDMTQRLRYAKSLRVPASPRRLLGASSSSTMTAKPLSRSASRWAQLKTRGSSSVRPRRLLGASVMPEPSRVICLLKGFRGSDETAGTSLRFWNQTDSAAYFNQPNIFAQRTPVFGLTQAPCGCVATAGATVLNYFQASNCVSFARECAIDGIGKTNLWTVGGPYDWKKFWAENTAKFGNPSDLTADGLELLGRVAWDVGVASRMSYGPAGSGAFTFDLAYALRHDFLLPSGRCVNMNGPNGGNVTPIASKYYKKLVYNQIRGGLPVIFGISCSKLAGAGHEVVAVGYGVDDDNADFTYVFTGWGGLGDAWYQLPNIDTKATAGDASSTYDIIGDMITQLSMDGKSVPLVGRVTDLDGNPVAGAKVWLQGGEEIPDEEVEYDGAKTMVTTDANGYWRMRVDPLFSPRVVYDPTGVAHPFDVGVDAYSVKSGDLKEGSAGYVAAATLDAALPDVMDFQIDPAKIVADPTALTFQTDPDTARQQALAQGKLLYVYGCAKGTSNPTAEEYESYLRTQTGLADKYVFLRLDSITQTGVAYATFDPRVFDPTKEIDWTSEVTFPPEAEDSDMAVWTVELDETGHGPNGSVDPETWDPAVFAIKSAVVRGPDCLAAGESGQCEIEIVFSDDTTNVVKEADWFLDNEALATISEMGLLTPKAGAAGSVVVSAKLRVGSWTPYDNVTTLTVQVGASSLTVVGGTAEDPLIAALGDDANVRDNAQYVALQGSFPTGVYPGVLKDDVTPGDEVTVESLYDLEIPEKSYRLRCVRPAILTGEVARAEMEAVGVALQQTLYTNADNQVVMKATFVPKMLTNYVQWVWTTGSWRVDVQGATDAIVDAEGSQWVDVGATLPVNVTLTKPDTVAVWTGCKAGELTTPTQALVKVTDAARSVSVFAQQTNVAFKVAKGTDLKVGPGYELELVEEGETEDTYKVVPSQGGEVVQPDPIAFQSITRIDETTWQLVVTNRVPFCNYRLLWTDDLTKGFTHTNDWEQAPADASPAWTNTINDASGSQLFWKAEAKEGQKE